MGKRSDTMDCKVYLFVLLYFSSHYCIFTGPAVVSVHSSVITAGYCAATHKGQDERGRGWSAMKG